MLVRLFEDNPNDREIRKIVELLRDGGVIIYPTDTIYAIGCDINSVKAVQRVSAIRGVKAEKANFSMICKDLGNIAAYAKVSNICNRNAADFRFRSSSGRSWKDFLGYYDFTDIFNTAQCDCSYTSSDQNLETAAGIA